MNYGLKLEAIVIEKDYILGGYGSLGGVVLQENGDWSEFLPTKELQATQVETFACTVFGTLSAVETLINRIEGKEKNYSDRWAAWNSDIGPGGASPSKTCEHIRLAGAPFEIKWPITQDIHTWEDFYKTPPPALFRDARTDFLEVYDFKHEYVPTDRESIKQALKLSPVCLAVTAWHSKEGVYYTPAGIQANHWVMCYGFDEEKQAFKIFDTYDSVLKLYIGEIAQAKRFQLLPAQKKTSLWQKIKELLGL